MNKISQLLNWIRDNQNGLFKIAIILILLYWTMLFKEVSRAIWVMSEIDSHMSSIHTELGNIREEFSHMNANRPIHFDH
jgi:hypothetical protein